MTNRVLVVWYSREATTSNVAKLLGRSLGADLDAIEEGASRAGIGGYLGSALKGVMNGLPAIRTERDPKDYELVVVGTPVWVGTMSSPVRSYLCAHRKDFRNAAFFAVMGGRGGEDTVNEMRLASGVSHAPSLVLTRRDVESDHHVAQCGGFLRSIRACLEGERRTPEPHHVVPVDFRQRPLAT